MVVRMGCGLGAEGVDLHYVDTVGVGIYQSMELGAICQLIETRVSESLRGISLGDEVT